MSLFFGRDSAAALLVHQYDHSLALDNFTGVTRHVRQRAMFIF